MAVYGAHLALWLSEATFHGALHSNLYFMVVCIQGDVAYVDNEQH